MELQFILSIIQRNQVDTLVAGNVKDRALCFNIGTNTMESNMMIEVLCLGLHQLHACQKEKENHPTVMKSKRT